MSFYISEYTVIPEGASASDPNVGHFRLRVSHRADNQYAVLRDGSYCLRHDGRKWSYESQPSSRTARFKAAYRMPAEQALALASKHVNLIKVNGRTYQEWQDHFASKEMSRG